MSASRLAKRALALSVSAAIVLAAGRGPAVSGQTASTPAPRPPAKGKTATPARLDLNRATEEEMVEKLPGIGVVTARKIIAGRPYARVDDLAKAGVPERTIEAVRGLVTIGPPPAATIIPAPRSRSAMPKETTAPTTTTKRIDLNTATPAELQTLPGIGAVTAAAIVAGRPYRSVDELEKVRGLGASHVAALRDRVTVAGPALAAPSPRAATKAAMPKAATPGRGGLAPGQLVNINKAPREELDLLPGIGPVKAQAIVEGRPFKTKQDIMKVKGIKQGEFDRIKDLITVD